MHSVLVAFVPLACFSKLFGFLHKQIASMKIDSGVIEKLFCFLLDLRSTGMCQKPLGRAKVQTGHSCR